MSALVQDAIDHTLLHISPLRILLQLRHKLWRIRKRHVRTVLEQNPDHLLRKPLQKVLFLDHIHLGDRVRNNRCIRRLVVKQLKISKSLESTVCRYGQARHSRCTCQLLLRTLRQRPLGNHSKCFHPTADNDVELLEQLSLTNQRLARMRMTFPFQVSACSSQLHVWDTLQTRKFSHESVLVLHLGIRGGPQKEITAKQHDHFANFRGHH
mmetsp:Transcript_34497/g.89927  ORF Transcript_34497/g.89927 Transcript_34497/m.89927 type:complete len:210 (+) Transcript_34497:883-1512(+)